MKKITEMVNQKIEAGKLLTVGIKCCGLSFIDSVIPEVLINDEESIYIEGGNVILDISKDKVENVTFDEYKEEYVIKCNDLIYSLS